MGGTNRIEEKTLTGVCVIFSPRARLSRTATYLGLRWAFIRVRFNLEARRICSAPLIGSIRTRTSHSSALRTARMAVYLASRELLESNLVCKNVHLVAMGGGCGRLWEVCAVPHSLSCAQIRTFFFIMLHTWLVFKHAGRSSPLCDASSMRHREAIVLLLLRQMDDRLQGWLAGKYAEKYDAVLYQRIASASVA